jgi:hypothetical protein
MVKQQPRIDKHRTASASAASVKGRPQRREPNATGVTSPDAARPPHDERG